MADHPAPLGEGPPSDPPLEDGPRFTLAFIEGRALVGFDARPLAPWLTARDFTMEIPDVRFPFDVSGGAARFRDRRCRLGAVTFEAAEAGVLAGALSGVDLPGHGLHEVEAAFRAGFVEVAGQLAAGRLEGGRPGDRVPFTLKLAVDPDAGGKVRLLLHDVRLYGPAALPAPAAALALVHALATGDAASVLSADPPAALRLDPVPAFARRLLPRHGWKLPDLREVALAEAELAPGRARLRFAAARPGGTLPEGAGAPLLTAAEGGRSFADAEAALARADWDEARRIWLELEGALPEHPFAAERTLAFLAAHAATRDHAADLAEAWLRRDPAFAPALWVRAAVAQGRGEPDAADRWLALAETASARGEPFSAAAAARAAAEAAEAAGDLDAAAHAWERALAARPRHPTALAALARLHPRRGDPAGTERVLRALAAEGPAADRARAHLALGRLHGGDAGGLGLPAGTPLPADPARARLHFDAALALDPGLVEAWAGLGRACAGLGEPLRAVRCLDRAREACLSAGRDDEAADLALETARLWERALGHPENALLRYRDVVARRPRHVEARLRQAVLARTLGRPGEAEAAFRQVLEGLPEAAPGTDAGATRLQAHRALAELAREAGDPARAARHLEAALDAGGDPDPALLEAWVATSRAAGDPEPLARACEAAGRRAHDDRRAADLLAEAGALRAGSGGNAAAAALFRAARMRRAGHPGACEGLADLWQRQAGGVDPDEAAAALASLGETRPDPDGRARAWLAAAALREEAGEARAALEAFARAAGAAADAPLRRRAAEGRVRAARALRNPGALGEALGALQSAFPEAAREVLDELLPEPRLRDALAAVKDGGAPALPPPLAAVAREAAAALARVADPALAAAGHRALAGLAADAPAAARHLEARLVLLTAADAPPLDREDRREALEALLGFDPHAAGRRRELAEFLAADDAPAALAHYELLLASARLQDPAQDAPGLRLRAAAVAEAAGRPDRARHHLGLYLAHVPGDLEALARQVVLLRRAEAWEALVPALLQQGELLAGREAAAPDVAEPFLEAAGLAAARLDRPDVARTCYERALAADPDCTAATDALGGLAWAAGDVAALAHAVARRAHQALRAGEADAPRRFLVAARLYLDPLGAPHRALEALDAALRHPEAMTPGEHAEARGLRLALRLQAGPPEAALEDLDALVDLSAGARPERRAALHRRRAALREATARVGGAREDWIEALRLDPAHPEAPERLVALAVRQAAGADGPEAAGPLLETAGRVASLGHDGMALRLTRLAFERAPSLPAAAALVDRLHRAGARAELEAPARLLAGTAVDALAQALDAGLDDVRSLLRRAAEGLLETGPEAALALLERLVDHAPGDAAAVDLLEDAARRRGELARLEPRLAAHVAAVRHPRRRREGERRQAVLAEELLAAREAAWRTRLARDPRDADALLDLAGLLEAQGRHAELAELARALQTAGAADEAAAMWRRVAAAAPEARERLNEAAAGLVLAGRAGEAAELLRGLAERTGDPADRRTAAEAALTAGDPRGFVDGMWESLEDEGLEGAVRALAARGLADVMAHRLDDAAGAAEVLRPLVERWPDDRALRRDRARLLSEAGAPDESLRTWLDLARGDPSDREALEAAAALSRVRAPFRAWLIQGLLAFVDGMGPRAAGAAAETLRLTEVARMALADPGAAGPVTWFLRAAAPHLEPLFPAELARYGVDPDAPLAPGHPTAARVRGWAEVLGVRRPVVYRAPALGLDFRLENTRPAALLLGDEVLEAAPGVQDQVLVRALDLLGAGYALPGKLAGPDVDVYLRLGLSFFEPEVGPRLPPGRLDRYHRALAGRLSEGDRTALEQLAREACAALPRFHAGGLAAALRRTADRVAVACTGDVPGALALCLRLDPAGPPEEATRAEALRAHPALFDLARFLLRDDLEETFGALRR